MSFNHLMSAKFFEVFGKVAVVVVVLGVVAGGAYFFGQKNIGTPKVEKEFVVATSDSSVTPTVAVTTVTPTSKPTLTTKVSAGTTTHTTYSLDVPEDWKSDHTIAEKDMDKLIISKNGYSVTIYQAAMGGAMYSFPDAKAEGPMTQEYKGTYSDFTGATGEKYRRIDSSAQNKPGEKNFTVLIFGTDTYQTPTLFGAISYTTPIAPDEKMLETMDSIISSLKK